MAHTPAQMTLAGLALVSGAAAGRLLHASTGLSFWGGVDPATGMVIDRHHPLQGECLAGCILALPGGRGSCSGSGVLMELIDNGHAPAAIVLCEKEEILTLGAVISREVFGRSIPVLRVSRSEFVTLSRFSHGQVMDTRLVVAEAPIDDAEPLAPLPATGPDTSLHLTDLDQAFLAGHHGQAAQVAMRLLVAMAELQGATAFLDVTQVHIDGCIYTGPASLRFAELMLSWGGRTRVPTTLNAISVDRRRWREQGVGDDFGHAASALADAYVAMGAEPTFTCAPYLLTSAPAAGEQIGWAESNAVVYANSVLGARTVKYPDYIDLCMALTGRAPRAGAHLDSGRVATMAIAVERPEGSDDSFWPLLGHCCGEKAASTIPLLTGLETSVGSPDDLKAFGAAFATTSSAPMFHILGITPEAGAQAPSNAISITKADLAATWRDLNQASSAEIQLVSLGNPHFSLTECGRLAALVSGRQKAAHVDVIVTLGRAVLEAASAAGFVATAEAFGVTFVTDTCWCMISEPVIRSSVSTLITNSGKYAHYGPGLSRRDVRFASLADCVAAACTGQAETTLPTWLSG